MGIFALLIGLVVLGLVIVGFIAYWVVMATLFIIGVVFVFWALLFTFAFGDPYVGSLCAVFATGISLWLFNLRGEKSR